MKPVGLVKPSTDGYRFRLIKQAGGESMYDDLGWQPVYLAPDPVGAKEVAQRLNVERRTVDQWRARTLPHPFPSPRWTVGGRPCWDWSDIEAWAKKTGRLK